jgi:hypothetical protein
MAVAHTLIGNSACGGGGLEVEYAISSWSAFPESVTCAWNWREEETLKSHLFPWGISISAWLILNHFDVASCLAFSGIHKLFMVPEFWDIKSEPLLDRLVHFDAKVCWDNIWMSGQS